MNYLAQLKALMPRGAAWTRAVGSNVEKLLTGLAVEFGRAQSRADALLEEMLPDTATELLGDWERVLGLPDACHDAPTTLAGRRAAAKARFIQRGGWTGGPSVPFLQSLAETLGYSDLTVRRFHLQPFTCDSECDDFVNPEEYIFVWEFEARHIDDDADARLVCNIERYALSALGKYYAFPLFHFEDGTHERNGTAVFIDPTTGRQSSLAADTLGSTYVEHAYES